MKIYTKVVLDLNGDLVEEESYEYSGPIAECAGSGGGGSSAGRVDYPPYMRDWHGRALGTDPIPSDITDIMNIAIGSSPFATAISYDPGGVITAYEAEISDFATILAGLDDSVDWNSFFVQAMTSIGVVPVIPDTANITGVTEAQIVADVAAFANQLDDEILTKILPRFEAGMRDINAVVSSAFPVGRSIIEGFRNREVAKHSSSLRLSTQSENARLLLENERMHLKVDEDNANIRLESSKLYLEAASQMTRMLANRISWEEVYMKTFIEGSRMKIVAMKEHVDVETKIAESDALWDLEVFKYGGNLLASISGAAVSAPRHGSAVASGIGGALSGVAAGALAGLAIPVVGPVAGAVAGGILGAAAGFLS